MIHDNKIGYIKELKQEFCFTLKELEPVAEFLLRESATVQAVHFGDVRADTRVEYLGNCGRIEVRYSKGGNLEVLGEDGIVYNL